MDCIIFLGGILCGNMFAWTVEFCLLNKKTSLKICDPLRGLVPFAQFKKRENAHAGVLFLVKLLALAWNFTKSNTPTWMFFTFFKFTNDTK